MNNKYSNTKATLAIAKASFRSILRSPSAVVFTLAFPLIFIIVFANIGGGGMSIDVGVAKGSDTSANNPVYTALKKNKIMHLIHDQTADEMSKNLAKGNLDAILDLKPFAPPASMTVHVQYSQASGDKGSVLKSALNNIFYRIQSEELKRIQSYTTVKVPNLIDLKEETISGRPYKYIDFILPGQLGFSLLSSGVFGTAFVFLSLRLTLVIKRFFATPVKRYSIVLGEAIARLAFSLLGSLFIILVGHYMFGFTLIHGVTTVLNMLVLSAIGLIIFMGFGFTVSGIAKNESSVPPLSNIITLPQFLLSGTFFSITAFPNWLQYISKVLPLTHLNDAMRKVAFEGAGLGDVTHQLLILFAWFIGIYAVAVKTFKWE
ncbi:MULTISPECIES: ABC transporter permease [Mucilaginibacter]|jgi:ABC-2 type transport system permease protein|uniref:Transport permease protein n=2 Tax=Mucilaginibacter TaxID=423349 RepID=A0AAE6MLS7_9SPHI|nr:MULTISPECIES: ABC transporter permease [Mucilaginibacter]NVM66310.1 ABC-2 type transport system permease protein [Mucilaginibacter sp. SG538B]QEM08076.1 ABC transporter permease [Mucilaginibacter rubeus]QEM20529.1 ABC transporter permease [Mucilaginibacter gossypii]QTE42747.1 ABC transporter permease [Mucilaginibacter rubeus]QTE49348.1 ABC transporter permease [Mucilaginibacter rubeus]